MKADAMITVRCPECGYTMEQDTTFDGRLAKTVATLSCHNTLCGLKNKKYKAIRVELEEA